MKEPKLFSVIFLLIILGWLVTTILSGIKSLSEPGSASGFDSKKLYPLSQTKDTDETVNETRIFHLVTAYQCGQTSVNLAST